MLVGAAFEQTAFPQRRITLVLVQRMDQVKWRMLEDWSKTNRAPRLAAFLHEREFKQ